MPNTYTYGYGEGGVYDDDSLLLFVVAVAERGLDSVLAVFFTVWPAGIIKQ
jgi:hypothetical protein